MIQREHLMPGDALPGEPTLAKRFGVVRMTVRHAIAELVEAGLLDRRRGAGTFVRRQTRCTVAIIVPTTTLHERTAHAWQHVLHILCQDIAERSAAPRLCLVNDGWLDDEAADSVQRGLIGGALMLGTPPDERRYVTALRRASVPLVGLFPNPQRTVLRHWVSAVSPVPAAVAALASEGHTRIGLAGRGFYRRPREREAALEAARRHGATIRPEWILPAAADLDNAILSGRRLARAWDQIEDRPTALLFLDHYEVQGFMFEHLGRGLPASELPRIAMTEFKEAPLDLPLPALRVQFKSAPVIHRAAEILFGLIAGHEVTSFHLIDLPVTLNASESNL